MEEIFAEREPNIDLPKKIKLLTAVQYVIVPKKKLSFCKYAFFIDKKIDM